MKHEKPQNIGCRVYKRHRVLLRQLARREKVSQSEIVRRAIEAYPTTWVSSFRRTDAPKV